MRMNPFQSTSHPLRREGVLAQSAAGMTVLLRLEGGEYYSLDEVGGRVWELSDGQRTVAEIAETLSREFAAEAAVIERDVLELLADLAHENLVATAQ